ncbi:hypothetical protein D9M70_566570 [compost metagenome]
MPVETLPLVGQGQVPGTACEYRAAQVLLQGSDLLAHCRLPHVQFARDRRERTTLHDAYEDAHAVEQIHRHSVSLWNR